METNFPVDDAFKLLINILGYTIVRFKATNPGYWPFHCHAMMHNLEGMLILLRIKDPNNPDRPIPPTGLPQCNSFAFKSNSYPWETGNLSSLKDGYLTYIASLENKHRKPNIFI